MSTKEIMKFIKHLMRIALGATVVALTALIFFSATQLVLSQPLEHATAHLSLF